MVNMLVVDDDELFKISIEELIENEHDLHIVTHAKNGIEALQKIQLHQVDLVLLDIQMPEMDGITCIQHIRAIDKELPILILTTFEEEEYIVKGLAYGANGYTVKGMEPARMIQVLRDAANRQCILPATIASKLSSYLLSQQKNEPELPSSFHFPTPKFTKKEQEIMILLAQLMTNQEIADKLFISSGTLRNYMTRIYSKLEVDNRMEAIQAIQTFRVL